MTTWSAYVVAGIALVLAMWAGYLSYRSRRITWGLVYAAGVFELVLLAQLVAGCIALAQTDRPVEGATFIGYLVTALVLPPAGIAWGFSDSSRWGAGVAAVAFVTVAILSARLLQVWNQPGV